MAKLGKKVDAIDVEPHHLKMVRAILAKHLPGKEVWAYGSRVKWNATERSDLDCVVFDATDAEIETARDIFSESEIPFEIQLFGWDNLSDDFKRNIETQYYLLQHAKPRSQWQEYKLDQLGTLQRGRSRHRPRYAFHLYGGKYPFIQTGEIREARKYIRHFENTYSEDGLKQSKLWPKGTLCITIAANIAEIAILDIDACFPDSVLGFIPDKKKADLNFIYYTLTYFQKELKHIGEGSVQDNINLGTFQDVLFPVPALPEQQAIAEVLSSLDDKIDLLHRQNKTLESLAETLFRQWFIEEPDPKWEEVKLGSVIETTSGGTPSRSNHLFYENGTHYWVKSKELKGNILLDTEEKINDEAIKKSSAKMLPKHSVLIAMYGANVSEYALIAKPMTCNQAICALKPNDNYPYSFIFLYVKKMKEEIEAMAVGSAQQNISQILIKQLDIIPPSKKILNFHEIVNPWFLKIETNYIQIQSLEKTRDELLPKLMSGEVRVSLYLTHHIESSKISQTSFQESL